MRKKKLTRIWMVILTILMANYYHILHDQKNNVDHQFINKDQIQTSQVPDTPDLYVTHGTFQDNVKLDWGDVSGADHYFIYRSSVFITVINQSVELIDISVDSDYIDIGLSAGMYYYALIANNSAGSSNLSNCEGILIAELFNLHPISPQIDNDGIIHLTWDEVPDTGNYSIIRHDSPMIVYNDSMTWVGLAYGTSFNDTVPGGGTYYYRVFATITGGGGRTSNLVSVLVELDIPSTPILYPIDPYVDTDGIITISWN